MNTNLLTRYVNREVERSTMRARDALLTGFNCTSLDYADFVGLIHASKLPVQVHAEPIADTANRSRLLLESGETLATLTLLHASRMPGTLSSVFSPQIRIRFEYAPKIAEDSPLVAKALVHGVLRGVGEYGVYGVHATTDPLAQPCQSLVVRDTNIPSFQRELEALTQPTNSRPAILQKTPLGMYELPLFFPGGSER